ncbi:MAG: 50S ribosomal protein L31 [Candidatus Shapirobacteria bacterium]|nr:50S ribosomal protein L31 [Candidatus Shapirobacteria bacterium]MDD4410340.1 50S ribosomal protein L31 [Candidatus Shapirobacteria bacterium]
MKQGIHPKYFDNCQVTCACGNKFTTGSTLEKIDVEVCSKCHPFFTGQQKFVDIKGRIDKFKEKVNQGKKYAAAKAAKKTVKKSN